VIAFGDLPLQEASEEEIIATWKTLRSRRLKVIASRP